MDETTQQGHVFETEAGWCGIAWSASGVTRFLLPVASEAAARRLMAQRANGAAAAAPSPDVAAVIDAVRRYFAGEATDFSKVPLDLGPQAPFFAQVYEAVRRVPWGGTTTYGAVAKALGAGPEAARDVGEAMARNKVPLIVPCHRVLAAGGRLGGFSAPGGAETKRRMLALEGVRLEDAAPAQQSFGF